MYYYHGSNKLFDKFDLSKSYNGVVYLTPHFDYAKNKALSLEGKEKYI